MWKYYSISTDSWADKIEIPAMSFSGGRALNTGSRGSATFKVKDPKVAEVLSLSSIQLMERALVATWNENAVYAGFLVDAEEDQKNGTLTVQHEDIWWVLARRYLLSIRGNGDQSAPPIRWSNVTLASIANLIVKKLLTGNPDARYNMPIITSAAVAGTATREYFGYEFLNGAAALDDIMSADGGPNIEFDCNWNGPGLEWVMRSGVLDSGLWEWDSTAAMTEVDQLKLKTNAQNMVNKVIGTGEGSERDRLVRDAADFSRPIPALELVKNFGSKDGAELQSRTTAALHASNDPTQQLSFRIPTTGEVSVADLRLGGTARVKSSGFYYLDAGWHDWRLISFDFDQDWINLQFQQIGG
ncbi:hypothetical protein OCL88_08310 [Paenarthrobacter sp. PAE-2]|uniref:hypothetical protein n=1 Tax=Paenarthrobacter sp. PAE-2 TaxID=2982532 RepID=UPI0022323A0F|nr:hypothetical protein [Paenarthrobacter sp. PAE-2]MCW3766475.1 hypothetical protein [Paenarthrobacter sp. PAE-2]